MALIDDVFPDILERVDPSYIFNCINVCKGWLEVITSPEFRQRYQKRWKANSKLVGFITYGPIDRGQEFEFGYQLSACCELGRIMNRNKSPGLASDYFISKSGAGDGLILFGSLIHRRLYVSNAGEMRPIQLPPLNLWLFKSSVSNAVILSQGNSSYKVIILSRMFDKVTIRTFSSSTNEWETSEVTLNGQIGPFIGAGMVSSSRGLVYWRVEEVFSNRRPAAVYDANNGCFRRIDQPPAGPVSHQLVHYGLSPQGNLLCAVSSRKTKINVWRLDDGDGWNLLHSVDSLYQSFVSFVPWTCDSVFVKPGSRQELCLYDLDTNKVDSLEFAGPTFLWKILVTLTMADLGVWPSSPFSNTAGTSNIHGIKQLLTW